MSDPREVESRGARQAAREKGRLEPTIQLVAAQNASGSGSSVAKIVASGGEVAPSNHYLYVAESSYTALIGKRMTLMLI